MEGGRWRIPTGLLEVKETPEEFPFGERGVRPVKFTVTDPTSFARLAPRQIPGVTVSGKRVECAWDCATTIAALLDGFEVDPRARQTGPTLDLVHKLIDDRNACRIPLPGLASYRAKGLDKKRRDYQADAALYMARRSSALLALSPRMGKTLSALVTLELLGIQRCLIICPSIAKYVWAEECARWLGESTAILFGRGGTEFRSYCVPCNGRGRTVDGSCQHCRARNGQSLGERIVTADEPDFLEQLFGHRIIIVNYDLLSPHKQIDLVGVESYREDLQGWGPVLAGWRTEVCILDELHICRTWEKSAQAGQPHRSELVYRVVENIQRVYGLTGTPIYSGVRDCFMQLNILSKGLWS